MELITNIAAVIGCITAVFSFIAVCTKAGRNWIKSIFKKNTQELANSDKQQNDDIAEIKALLEKINGRLKVFDDRLDGLEKQSAQQCRDTIKSIYYKYQASKKIPLYERKTADRTYEIYTTVFHGNSYAALLYTEICKWDIDTITYQDFDEE